MRQKMGHFVGASASLSRKSTPRPGLALLVRRQSTEARSCAGVGLIWNLALFRVLFERGDILRLRDCIRN